MLSKVEMHGAVTGTKPTMARLALPESTGTIPTVDTVQGSETWNRLE
jgi:hypothetical protein